jgi:hypothetical protein
MARKNGLELDHGLDLNSVRAILPQGLLFLRGVIVEINASGGGKIVRPACPYSTASSCCLSLACNSTGSFFPPTVQ